jgi:hypothetical protein
VYISFANDLSGLREDSHDGPSAIRSRAGYLHHSGGRDLASSTGECGDPAGALRLSLELLPDQVRILGPAHPDRLATRANIKHLTEALQASTQCPDDATGAATPPKTGPLNW